MNKQYEGYKVIKLEYEGKKYENYKDTWDIIGIRDECVCPECQYLGRTCDLCGGDF